MKNTTLIFIIFLSVLLGTEIYSQTVVQNLSAATPSLRPLIATEGEVMQFFVKYIERYVTKDIDGFLWLFSSKAKQNREDGISGIREIYSSFFNESQNLRYHMEDRKVEIYENGVEVKARYVIEQTMMKSGEIRVWKGKGRWVLIKEGGDLKIFSIDYQNEKTP
jgi:hypothetical protein